MSTRFGIDIITDDCVELIGGGYDHPHIYKVLINYIVGCHSSSSVVGEFEGVSWKKIPYFLNNIDNSKALVIIRDPRDVLVSFKKNTIAPNNDYLISVFNSLGLMQNCIKYKVKFGNRFFSIQFEELKEDTEKVVRNVVDFLDINYEEGMLDEHNWKKLRLNGWVDWENHGVSSFAESDRYRSNPVGRWRELIDPVDHFICEWINGSVMYNFGFGKEFNNLSDEA